MLLQNVMVQEAWNALRALGERDLPAVDIGFRLSLNTNHLRTIIDTIDQERLKLAEKHGVKGNKPDDMTKEEWADRLEPFTEDYYALLKQEIEWASPARIDVRKFTKYPVPANALAALLQVGILFDGESEEPKPKKKGKSEKSD
jgi:hypothetical protein